MYTAYSVLFHYDNRMTVRTALFKAKNRLKAALRAPPKLPAIFGFAIYRDVPFGQSKVGFMKIFAAKELLWR